VKQVRIIDRASGRNVQYRLREESAVIKVTAGSTVQIAASRESIIAWERDGNDLLLRFADGTTLRLQDYFECLAEDFNELILVESREDILRVILEGEFCASSRWLLNEPVIPGSGLASALPVRRRPTRSSARAAAAARRPPP
jgi:hypothetical protein